MLLAIIEGIKMGVSFFGVVILDREYFLYCVLYVVVRYI